MADIIFGAYSFLLLGAQAGGSAYFASTVSQELRPYFDSHGMRGEASDAGQAFGYLVASAIFAGLSVVGMLMNMCRGSRGSEEDGEGLYSIVFGVSVAIIFTVFACLTIQHSWGWWQHFAAEGNDHLAEVSRGLAAFLISIIVLSAVGSITWIVATLACFKVTHRLGEDQS
ncbi:hypothetical protein GGR53DRAFT_532019 [Hypoxylon sp. FL1150]|nr:hypothetical protein GGR53DRAFT_532019 [Hypoxylon sp. FL1150]